MERKIVARIKAPVHRILFFEEDRIQGRTLQEIRNIAKQRYCEMLENLESDAFEFQITME